MVINNCDNDGGLYGWILLELVAMFMLLFVVNNGCHGINDNNKDDDGSSNVVYNGL